MTGNDGEVKGLSEGDSGGRAIDTPALSSLSARAPTPLSFSLSNLQRSSSSWRKTSPMICPTDCNAFRSSSVLSCAPRSARTTSRRPRARASASLCASSLRLYSVMAVARRDASSSTGGAGVAVGSASIEKKSVCFGRRRMCVSGGQRACATLGCVWGVERGSVPCVRVCAGEGREPVCVPGNESVATWRRAFFFNALRSHSLSFHSVRHLRHTRAQRAPDSRAHAIRSHA